MALQKSADILLKRKKVSAASTNLRFPNNPNRLRGCATPYVWFATA